MSVPASRVFLDCAAPHRLLTVARTSQRALNRRDGGSAPLTHRPLLQSQCIDVKRGLDAPHPKGLLHTVQYLVPGIFLLSYVFGAMKMTLHLRGIDSIIFYLSSKGTHLRVIRRCTGSIFARSR